MEILPDCLSLWQESEKTMNETNTLQSAPVVGISRHRLTTDGEGVTTLVVFHGCPLRCKYCLNPHTLSPETIQPVYDTQLLYDEVKIDELYFLGHQRRHHFWWRRTLSAEQIHRRVPPTVR